MTAARDQLRAGGLRDRHRLARHQRLVDGARAFDDHAVRRDLLARPDAQQVADGDAVEIDFLFAAVGRDAKRALRLQIEKRADGVPGPLARRQLQHLPDQYEHM